MITHTIATTYQTPGGSFVRTSVVTGDTELNADVALSGTTPATWTEGIVRANIQCLMVQCTSGCTVKANGSGGATLFTLAANTPLVYPDHATAAAALGAADITSLYLVPSADGVFSLRAILTNQS